MSLQGNLLRHIYVPFVTSTDTSSVGVADQNGHRVVGFLEQRAGIVEHRWQ